MKQILVWVILIAFLFFGVNYYAWQQGTANILVLANQSVCDRSLTYKIDFVDPRFGVSRNSFIIDAKAASQIWNQALDKKLLKYDQEEGKIKINLVFDERSGLSSKIFKIKDDLESKKGDLYNSIEDYEIKSEEFKIKIEELNKEINEWNGRGGAPKEVYERLINEQNELKKEADELNARAKSLNRTADSFNAQVGVLNSSVDEFNEALSQKPEEGIFDPNNKKIDIYFSLNNQELIHTLAHEMGHALGLPHNNNQKSIMFSFSTQSLKLTPKDLEDLEQVCSANYLAEKFRGYLFNLSLYLRATIGNTVTN